MDTMIGHNKPPTLTEEIAARNAALLADIEEVIANELPMLVVDDDAAAQVSAVGKEATALVARVNATHTAEKKPHLDAGREVDAWKNDMLKPLTDFLNDCKALVGTYQDKKEREERERLETERRRLAAEAEAEAQRAMKAMTPDALNRAAEVAEAAQVAEAATNVKTADLARVSVGGKAVASRSAKWTYEVTNAADVPRVYLSVDDAKVKAAIAGENGKREIAGLRIFEAKSTSFR